MKVLGQGISLALVAAGLAAAPALAAQAAQAPAAPAAAQPSLVQKMKDTAEGSVTTSPEDATGKVDFVRAGRNGDLLPSTRRQHRRRRGQGRRLPRQVRAPRSAPRTGELQRRRRSRRTTGWTVNYTQSYKGVPVFGSMLRAHVDTRAT